MTAPDKPGLSNEEFIDFNQIFLEKASTKGLRNMLNVDMVLAQTLKEALDRLDALVKANEDRDLTPKNLKEFRLKLFNDPVAYAYYNMGAAVERDKRLSPEERTRKNWDAIYSAISCGFENKILPDIWTAEFAATDKDKP